MSQNYFDKYVNQIGEEAKLFATVINRNQITREGDLQIEFER